MGGASDYVENKMLDAILGTGFTKPAAVYMALFTSYPTDAGTGTEVSGNGYARVDVTALWAAASGGQKKNSGAINFPAASGSWGTITHWALFTASSGGNMLFYGELSAPATTIVGTVLQFPVDSVVISQD